MRKCVRCGETTVDDCYINIWGFGREYLEIISEKNGKKIKLENIKSAVCPNCGEVSIYVNEHSKLISE